MNDNFVGLIILVFLIFVDDMGVVVCLFEEFVKINKVFEFKVVVFEGKFY